MKLRKLLPLIFALMLVHTCAHAEDIARYLLKNSSYDTETNTYTAEVYLDTKHYLSTGSFGMNYDKVSPIFELDETNFTYFRHLNSENDSYIAFQWYLNDIGYTTGEIHLGTITVDNVVPKDSGETPSGLYDTTFTQLDWLKTDSAQTDFYNTDYEGDGLVLNDEIWRAFDTDAEREATGLTGFYQGYDFQDENNPAWVDIGFVNELGLPEKAGQTISGKIQSYNPKNSITIVLREKNSTEAKKTTELKSYSTEYPDGRAICSYNIEADAGDYTLAISKNEHLTYTADISVEAEKDVQNDTIELLCGDVTHDEKIKLDDRTALLHCLNKRIAPQGEYEKYDLNGDGKVTLHDLNILKSYLNKKY